MAPPQNVFFIVYCNGQVLRNEFGVYFESNEKFGFNISVKSTFTHLKKRIEEKLKLGDNKVVSRIFYRNPAFFGGGGVHFEDTSIRDNDDVANMFEVHRNFQEAKSIEINVTVEDGNQHQNNSTPIQNPYTHEYPYTQEYPTQQSTPIQNPYTQEYPTQQSTPIQNPYTHQTCHIPQPSDEYVPSSSQLPLHEEEIGDESEEDEELLNLLEGEEDDEDDEEGEDEDVWANILHPTQWQQEATQIREAYCPPLHMRDLDMDLVDRHMDKEGVIPLPVDEGIKEGMQFHNKEDCVLAVRYYHVKKSLDYKVTKSDQLRYVIGCTNSACRFRLRASLSKRSGKWKIVTMIGPHNCTSSSMSQDHRKLDYNVICESIKSLVHKDASIKPSMIIAYIRERFNYTVTYRKAWMAKNKAVESIYGNWEKSFEELPQWLMVMKNSNPGTIVDLKTLPNPDGTTKFHRLFWAFHPCIEGFKFCKPVIHVDGTWLYGKYRGTLLLAVAQDGNNKTIPIAFALVEGETKEGWGFFLEI